MSRPLAGAVSVALVTVLASAPAATGGAAGTRQRSTCQRLQGRDLAPARFVKLVERRDGDLVGCVLPRGAVRRVAASGPDDDGETHHDYTLEQVVGRIVVVRTGDTNDYATSISTRVHDLRAGRGYALAERCSVKAAFPCSGDMVSTVTAALVTRAGRAVAVVVDDGAPEQSARVVAYSTLGTRRVLDTGAIAPESLRLTGNLASWTNAGTPRGASVTAG